MKKWLAYLAVLAVHLLGFSAMTAGVYRPSYGWTLFSIIPAVLAAWYLATVAAEQSRVASQRPKRHSNRFPIVLGVLMFFGPYMFANWFLGSTLTLVLGKPHQRMAIVHRWDSNGRSSRRGSRCVRIGAMIETPRKIPVNLCLHRRYGFVLGSGSVVYFRTHESIIGDMVLPEVYFPELPRPGHGSR
ncbi:hypothetical protein ACFOLC_15275 [Lysobacter cavernae]|uniref:Uncharacterized protein n=1 Tax=Lysobacter cavernae TaxID=1685901 RepID=A0ABV7RRX2_9GAMM